jgi:hypothetical protein
MVPGIGRRYSGDRCLAPSVDRSKIRRRCHCDAHDGLDIAARRHERKLMQKIELSFGQALQ